MTTLNKFEARGIYKEIEKELKDQAADPSDAYDTGISIPEIIERFRKNRSEATFKHKILPFLENHRKNDKRIAVFSKTENAKLISVWQYKK